MDTARRQLILLAILLVLSCIAFLLSLAPTPVAMVPQAPAEKSLAETIRAGKAPRPAFSTTTKEKLERSKGPNALLSYTQMGFEPREVTIKQGESVRFTNNSNRDIWIAAAAESGEHLYPGVPNGCGSSELDSCGAIPPQDFWEFTFDAKGSWGVANAFDAANIAVVRVR